MYVTTLLLTLTLNAAPTTQSIQSKAFLQKPADVTGDFSMAKTPPKVDITLIENLPTDAKGTLWSSWGDGLLASNGKYYAGIGDHAGIDSTSHVYEYDPKTKKLTKVIDVAKAIGQKTGAYGHGKIHSGIHEAKDGWIYFSTYWGKHREIFAAFGKGYNGSILLRFHPKTGKVENLGAIAPKAGLPTSYFDRERGLLYFYAVSRPNASVPYRGDITVYDIAKKKVIFHGGGDITTGQRAFLADKNGRVYFSAKDNRLHYYDPETNKLASTKAELPEGDTLRAGAPVLSNGMIYGMTRKGMLFSFDPKTQKLTNLGMNFEKGHYTSVMVTSPDEKYLYYLPGAHGSSYRIGTPVVQYEIKTGKQKVLGFLNEEVRKKVNYNLGGIYNLQIDDKGETLYTTFNGAPYESGPRKVPGFGKPSIVVIHIPKSER